MSNPLAEEAVIDVLQRAGYGMPAVHIAKNIDKFSYVEVCRAISSLSKRSILFEEEIGGHDTRSGDWDDTLYSLIP